MVRAEEYIRMQMIEQAWKYASHYGGHENMLGVLHVIKNREAAGWGTFLHILDTMEKWQAAPPVTTTHPDIWNRNFVKVLGEVDAICDGTRKDPTNKATYFGDTTNITSDWFLQNVARTRERCGDNCTFTYWK